MSRNSATGVIRHLAIHRAVSKYRDFVRSVLPVIGEIYV